MPHTLKVIAEKLRAISLYRIRDYPNGTLHYLGELADSIDTESASLDMRLPSNKEVVISAEEYGNLVDAEQKLERVALFLHTQMKNADMCHRSKINISSEKLYDTTRQLDDDMGGFISDTLIRQSRKRLDSMFSGI